MPAHLALRVTRTCCAVTHECERCSERESARVSSREFVREDC